MDVDITDGNSCWYMMAVPNTLYQGAYLHGYQGVCNCTLNWQSLWVR